MKTALCAYKDDINRNFRILGADRGFDQNVTDIIHWYRLGLLTDTEYKLLRKYNRTAYSELPINS